MLRFLFGAFVELCQLLLVLVAALFAIEIAIFARCGYCGTDSLVTELADAVSALHEALRGELKTIAEAVTALVYRRRLVVAGIAIVLGVLAVLVAGVRLAA